MSHYRNSKDFVPDMTNLPQPELLDKGMPSKPGPPLAGGYCTSKDHSFDGTRRDDQGKCPKCEAELAEAKRDNQAHSAVPGHDLVEYARRTLDRKIGIKEVQRVEHESGMIRDTTQGKTNWLLVFDGPLLERWAEHLTKGAITKGKRNWMKAGDNPDTAPDDLERFREGAARHFAQWLAGEDDEDHAAAVIFNLNGACLVEDKLKRRNG